MGKVIRYKSGEWTRPIMEGFRFICCDCNLVHVMNFEVEEDGRVIFQVFREDDLPEDYPRTAP